MKHQLRVTRVALIVGVLLTASAALAGCGDDGAEGSDSTTLRVSVFGNFGYEKLYDQFEKDHPGVKIVETSEGDLGAYNTALTQKIAAGAAPGDVVAIEEGQVVNFLQSADKFVNFQDHGSNDKKDQWLPWKYAQATTSDGSDTIGLGTDVGGLAMCYRKDLFDAAGLPSDAESVKAMFATWDSYFAAGDKFMTKANGAAWFDSAAQVFNAMHNQHELGYFDQQDKLVIETNPAIKSDWAAVTGAVAKGQSAKLPAWSKEWEAGVKAGAFATKTCPAWMLGGIEKLGGPEVKGKWAVTEAFPGGGGNWGGSYLTVPKQSKNAKKAAELAAWLTAPEQQIKAFKAKATFPSQVKALTDPALLEQTNAYFGDIKVGALFAAQAKKITAAQYKGPTDGQIQDTVVSAALLSVEQGKSSADDAWKTAVAEAQKVAK